MVADERRVVEGNRHGGIGADGNRLCADASYLDVITGEVRFGEGEVRDLFHQIGAACCLRCCQLFLTHRRDRDGHALHIGSAQFGRGNGDGFDGASGNG